MLFRSLAINQAYVDVQQRLNVLAIFMLFPALLAVCLMKNVHLEKEDQGQGEGVVVLGRASFLGTLVLGCPYLLAS